MGEGKDSADRTIDPEAVARGQRHIIRRPRLERMLDETQAKIILLVAPAGYGKTTLARQWMERRRHAWVQATPASADVMEIAAALASAAADLSPSRARNVVLPRSPFNEEAVAKTVKELIDQATADSWLVIDDYQLLSSESERFTERAIASTTAHVLVATRQRPSWATARRILYGEICEIGTAALAMTAEEASAVLRGRPADDLPGFLGLADGWPAVIGLASYLDGLPKHPDSDVPVALFDYFAEELFRELSETERRSLIALAWAPPVDQEVLTSLLPGLDAESVESLLLSGLVASAQGQISLHPLVRAYVRRRTRGDIDEADVAALLDRLCELSAWDAAYDLVSEFEMHDAALQLLATSLSDLLERGRTGTVERWTQELRKRGLASPGLDLAEAEVACRWGAYGEAEALAVRAAKGTDRTDLKCRAYLLAGQSAHLDSRLLAAREHFRASADVAATPAEKRAALWGQFLAAAETDPRSARELARQLEEDESLVPEDQLRAQTGLLILASFQGGILGALPAARAAMSLVEAVGDPYIRTSFLNSISHTLSFGGFYAEALPLAVREYTDAKDHGLAFALPHAKIAEALALCGLRRFSEASAALDEAAGGRVSRDLHAQNNELLARARIAAMVGDLELALEVTSTAPEMASAAMHAEWLATRALTQVVAYQNPDDGLKNAAAAKALGPDAISRTLIELVQAVSAIKAGVTPAAQRLARVLLEGGHLDSLVFAYRVFPDLLPVVLGAEDFASTGAELLGRARDYDLARTYEIAVRRKLEPRELLSPREREVYELLSGGLSNRDIAKRLFISEVTVKVHVRHIYEKLGVRSRTQAALLRNRAPREDGLQDD